MLLLIVLYPIGAIPVSAQTAGLPSYPIRWLVAGDSFSSGQGLPAVAESSCQRAFYSEEFPSKAWAVVAREHLEDANNPSNSGRPLQVVADSNGKKGFDFVACGGAVTQDFFSNDRKKKQWDRNHNGRFDLVTLSMGGNDIGFPEAMMQCVGADKLAESLASGGSMGGLLGATAAGAGTLAASTNAWTSPARCPADEDLRQRINHLGEAGNVVDGKQLPGYKEFLKEVAVQAVVPGGHIVVVGYPAMFEDPDMWSGGAQAGDVCQMVRRTDAHMLRGVAGLLNQTIGNAVRIVNDEKPNGVTLSFVDVNTGNEAVAHDNLNLYEPNRGPRHNLCSGASKDQWLNGVTPRYLFKGSFHPTQDGHNHTGALVAEHIRTLAWRVPDAPAKPPVVVPPPAEPTRPVARNSVTPGSPFNARCVIAWPTAPSRGSQSIQMRTSCSGVPNDILFVDIVYADPNLPVTPSRSTMQVQGRVHDLVRSEYGFKVLVVEAHHIELLRGG